MATAKQRRPTTEPVTFSFLTPSPVVVRMTVTAESDRRTVSLTCARPGHHEPMLNSAVSVGPITHGIITTIVAALAKAQDRSAGAQPATA